VDLSISDDNEEDYSLENWVGSEVFNNRIDEQTTAVQDQLRREQLIRTKLGHLYDKQAADLIVPMYEYQLTATHFPAGDKIKVSSNGKLKIFYCITWFVDRNEKRRNFQKCPYNLFWYEPITSFTTVIGKGNIDRAFIAFRPLLDLSCLPTNYFFIYAMYTMCENPILVVLLYNMTNGQIEFKNSYKGTNVQFICKFGFIMTL
jgi:hypothetical protein